MVEIAPVQVALTNPVLLDVSPDGSRFLVASYTGATTISHPIWSASILGGSLKYLAVGTDASWSPDGNSVAYSTPDGEIFLIRNDGTGAHKVASLGGLARFLSWSPDGETIRFSKDHELWEMGSGGSNPHRLFPGRQANERLGGHWAPDGSRYYFISNDQIWVRDERGGLLRHSPSQPVQLTSGPIAWGNPIPGRDGKKIFVRGSTPHGELVRFDSQSRQFQPYLAGISADNLCFSNDGQEVAYVSYPENILWRTKIDGSNRIQLTNAPMQPAEPSWSPDGSRLLFIDSTPRGDKTYIVPSQGGTPEPLLPDDRGPQTTPNWSSDGRKVVFSTSQSGGADPKSLIKILDLDTNRITTVLGSVGMFAPRWSPDGRSIAAVRMNSTTLNIFDIKTQQWSTPYKGVVSYHAWSKDSQRIYFLDFQGSPAVFRIHLSNRVVDRVADVKDLSYTGNNGMWMGMDPTEAPLFLRNLGTRDIYALTLEEK